MLKWVEEERSISFIARELRCRGATVKNYLKKFGVEDYKGNQGCRGQKKSHQRKSAEEYLNIPHPNSNRLRQKLIEDGIKKAECEICGLSKWNDKPIPLELHHVDGDRFNNVLINLQILCANCHRQTDNYGSKNKRYKDAPVMEW